MGAGNELPVNTEAIGSCDVPYWSGCVDKACQNYCQTIYGTNAHGFCYNSKCRNDTCVCRRPCTNNSHS